MTVMSRISYVHACVLSYVCAFVRAYVCVCVCVGRVNIQLLLTLVSVQSACAWAYINWQH